MNLSQSEWIALAILGGFVIYLTIRNKLGNYWLLLTGGGASPAKTAAAQGAASSTAGGVVGSILGGLGAATGDPAAGAIGGVVSGQDAGGVVGTAASTAAGPSSVGGTITSDGQTSSTSFPQFGFNPMSMVTF